MFPQMHYMDADFVYRKKSSTRIGLEWDYVKQILEVTPHKTSTVQPPTTHL